MSLRSMLRSKGTLERQTAAKDASGGRTQTWATVTTDIPCDIQPASGNLRFTYAQRHLVVTHQIFVASDIEARETDRFTSDSRSFRVMGWTPPAPGYAQWPGRLDVEEVLHS